MLLLEKYSSCYSNPISYLKEVEMLGNEINIEELTTVEGHLDGLSELLVKVVEEGASIGFLPPLGIVESEAYWKNVLNPGVILYVTKIDDQIAGSVQLHLCSKQNGTHRAEIAKLMTHPHFRRKGIGKLLMQKIEERAKKENRVLLVLDTREGDPSNRLYQSLDYINVGRIPNYARSENGQLDATVIYYKNIVL
jgi:ribosomal protein S18 acetylase RimI-like enzyme